MNDALIISAHIFGQDRNSIGVRRDICIGRNIAGLVSCSEGGHARRGSEEQRVVTMVGL